MTIPLKRALLKNHTPPPSISSPPIPVSAPRGPGPPGAPPAPNLPPRFSMPSSRCMHACIDYLLPCCWTLAMFFCSCSHICRGSAPIASVCACARLRYRFGGYCSMSREMWWMCWSIFDGLCIKSSRRWPLSRAHARERQGSARELIDMESTKYPSLRTDISKHNMESFALAAQHAGKIKHQHIFAFSSSAVDALKEVRLAVTIVVIGWVAVTALRGYFWHNRSNER